MAVRRPIGRGSRRAGPVAIQKALFDVEIRPERRFYRLMFDAFGRAGVGADALESELIVSRLFGTVWAGQDGPRDGSTEEAFGLGMVDFGRGHRTPTTVAALQAVAAVAPIREVRESAQAAAVALIQAGLPVPRWEPQIGTVTALRCWAYQDVFGDEATVLCEFAYGAEPATAVRHGVLVSVDHAQASVATDAMLVREVDAVVRDLRNDAQNGASVYTFAQVDQAWAGALLARAFARTDLDRAHTQPTYAQARALALARIALLPTGAAVLPADALPAGPARRQALAEEFLASAYAEGLPASAARVVAMIVEHGCRHDPGDPGRVSPAKWEAFAFEWLPGQPPLAHADVTDLPAIARAWSVWAARRANLPGAAQSELGAALEEILDELAARAPAGGPLPDE